MVAVWNWASSNSWLFSNNRLMERFQNHQKKQKRQHFIFWDIVEPVPGSYLHCYKVVWLLKTTSCACSRCSPQVHSCLPINHHSFVESWIEHGIAMPHTWIPHKLASGPWKIKSFSSGFELGVWQRWRGTDLLPLTLQISFLPQGSVVSLHPFWGIWRMTRYKMTECWTMSLCLLSK